MNLVEAVRNLWRNCGEFESLLKCMIGDGSRINIVWMFFPNKLLVGEHELLDLCDALCVGHDAGEVGFS